MRKSPALDLTLDHWISSDAETMLKSFPYSVANYKPSNLDLKAEDRRERRNTFNTLFQELDKLS